MRIGAAELECRSAARGLGRAADARSGRFRATLASVLLAAAVGCGSSHRARDGRPDAALAGPEVDAAARDGSAGPWTDDGSTEQLDAGSRADAGSRPFDAGGDPPDAAMGGAGGSGSTPDRGPESPERVVALPAPELGACAFVEQPASGSAADNASCPEGVFTGDVLVRTREDVEMLAGCGRIRGDVRVASESLADLQGLESLAVIEGSLEIPGPRCAEGVCTGENPSLRRLTGLEGLRCVGGNLSVAHAEEGACRSIDLAALVALVEVGGSLELEVCSGSDADRFESLQRVWGDLRSRVALAPPRLQAVYGELLAAGSYPEDLYVGCGSGAPPCRDGVLGCAYEAETQPEVDALGRCALAVQDLRLTGPSIAALTALSKLREVRGELRIGPPGDATGSGPGQLASLAGLESLARVGRLSIAGLPQLETLETLGQLREARSIVLEHLDVLLDLFGLEGVRRLDEGLWIRGLAQLDTLTGLSLTAANAVELVDNPALTSVGALAPLAGSVERLVLRELPALNSLDGLQQLDAVEVLVVERCAGLVDLTELSVSHVRALELIELPSLSTLEGLLLPSVLGLEALHLRGLPWIQSFAGLEGLTSVDQLSVEGCDSVADLSGFAGLSSVEGTVSLTANASLQTLEGAPLLARIGQLRIEANPELRSLAGLDALARTRVRAADLPSLESLAGLSGVAIEAIDLEALTMIRDLAGLEGALETVEVVRLAANTELASLAALAELRAIEGQLEITANPRLLDLSGLEGLQSLQTASITDNQSLEQVRALAGLVEGLVAISGNPSLPQCEVDWLSERLPNPIPPAENGGEGLCPP